MTKPGWKTTEFAFCALAFALSALLAADVFDANSKWLQLIGAAGSFLTALGYTVSRTSVKANALRAIEVASRKTTVLIVLVAALAACGASTRERAVYATYTATVSAQRAFQAYELKREAEIRAAATSYEQGRAALDAYRAKSDRVVQLFEGAYRALAAAAVLKDDPRAFAALTEAFGLLSQALRDISGGKLP